MLVGKVRVSFPRVDVETHRASSSRHRRPSNARVVLSVIALCGIAACDVDDGAPEISETVLGHCVYENPFAQQEECREFRGEGWTVDDAQASCDEESATFVDGPCTYDNTFGACVLETDDDDKQLVLVAPGDDPTACTDQQRGCELFGGGKFVVGNVCGGDNPDVDVDDLYSDDYVTPAENICVEPNDDVTGTAADGKVCTWQQMSGCTEPGRAFEEYASCDAVRTQRPYYPAPPADDADPVNDTRLQDPAYKAELDWVTAQVNSCACVCCHKTSIAPAAIFDTDAAGNWVNTFSNWGIAFAARAFDSSLLGSYTAADNNGFSRFVAGLPSTDEPRMKAFFEREMTHRGLSAADFADIGPQPAIFASQANYDVKACENGEGVRADGTMTWTGGRARYLYVLDVGAENPGVPPNLDVPLGTIWKVDTIPPAIPAKTAEVRFGEIPSGMLQAYPVDDVAPVALVTGRDYVLFALADIGVPMTRCVFTMGQ